MVSANVWPSRESGYAIRPSNTRLIVGFALHLPLNSHVISADEATSALDVDFPTFSSRSHRRWRRKNRSTIVITHDLSPIGEEDFVYVLANGRIVEQGYRVDLSFTRW